VTEQEKLFQAFLILFLVGLALLVATVSGSIVASLAERRGHSRRKWFWLGFFLNVFAITALYIIKPSRSPCCRPWASHWSGSIWVD